MRATFDVLGARPRGCGLHCRNRIPQARGMGSSSAAIVAGVLLARGLVADGEERLDDEAALRVAARDRGTPGQRGALPARRVHDRLDASRAARGRCRCRPWRSCGRRVFVPTGRGLTAVARAALPAAVPHADAAFNAGRGALLVARADPADPALLLRATDDRLHQDYRAAGMPETAALVARLRGGRSGGGGQRGGADRAGADRAGRLNPERIRAGRARLPWMSTEPGRVRGRLGHAERGPVAAGRKS